MTHSELEHQEGDWEVFPVTDPQILPPANYPPLRSNSFLYILIANGKWQCFTTYIWRETIRSSCQNCKKNMFWTHSLTHAFHLRETVLQTQIHTQRFVNKGMCDGTLCNTKINLNVTQNSFWKNYVDPHTGLSNQRLNWRLKAQKRILIWLHLYRRYKYKNICIIP